MRKLEVISLTLHDARQALAGGASSLELVKDLDVGGLTPPLDLVQAIRDAVSLHLRVIVRPQARDFVYSPAEIEQMQKDIAALKKIGVEGIVFGALRPDHTLDMDLILQTARLIAPLEMTLHRAIDESQKTDLAFPALKGNVQRVLTSGLASNVWDGRAKIREWIERFGQNFTFACGGGIRMDRLEAIVQATDAPEYHVGTAARTDQHVDSAKVRLMVEMINKPATNS